MPDLTKIATCSYCGTRSVLRLAGQVQNELACSACGARLHNMKPMKAPTRPAPKRTRKSPLHPRGQVQKQRQAKRRIPLMARMADFLEDILDEVEDIFD